MVAAMAHDMDHPGEWLVLAHIRCSFLLLCATLALRRREQCVPGELQGPAGGDLQRLLGWVGGSRRATCAAHTHPKHSTWMGARVVWNDSSDVCDDIMLMPRCCTRWRACPDDIRASRAPLIIRDRLPCLHPQCWRTGTWPASTPCCPAGPTSTSLAAWSRGSGARCAALCYAALCCAVLCHTVVRCITVLRLAVTCRAALDWAAPCRARLEGQESLSKTSRLPHLRLPRSCARWSLARCWPQTWCTTSPWWVRGWAGNGRLLLLSCVLLRLLQRVSPTLLLCMLLNLPPFAVTSAEGWQAGSVLRAARSQHRGAPPCPASRPAAVRPWAGWRERLAKFCVQPQAALPCHCAAAAAVDQLLSKVNEFLPALLRTDDQFCLMPRSDGLPRLFDSAEERQLLLNLLLHCADISNPGECGTHAGVG